jgi:hypothetical protein
MKVVALKGVNIGLILCRHMHVYAFLLTFEAVDGCARNIVWTLYYLKPLSVLYF